MTRSTDARAERREVSDEDLAAAIEAAWLARWGAIPVVAQVVIAKIRRGTP